MNANRGKARAALFTVRFGAVIILLLSGASCGGSGGDSGGDHRPVWGDSGVRLSVMDVDGHAAGSYSFTAPAARAVDAGALTDKVSFRSSDVEFWSIGSVSEIEDISSAKYGQGTYATGESLQYSLGDVMESVVFSPDGVVYKDLSGNDGTWAAKVADFVAAGKTDINLMRLDIGDGRITFLVDGEVVDVNCPDGDISRINTNSIVFVDEQFLSAPAYISRSTAAKIAAGTVTASGLGMSAADFGVVQAVILNNNYYGTDDTYIDADGGLFIPMTPVDISSYDPATDSLTVSLEWDIAGAIYTDGSAYYMTDRVQGTCFDFSVELQIE
jgi:hypothetical protein